MCVCFFPETPSGWLEGKERGCRVNPALQSLAGKQFSCGYKCILWNGVGLTSFSKDHSKGSAVLQGHVTPTDSVCLELS